MILSVAVKVIGTTAWIIVANTMMHSATKTGRNVFFWSLMGNVAFYVPFGLLAVPTVLLEPYLLGSNQLRAGVLLLIGCSAIATSVLLGWWLVSLARSRAEVPFEDEISLLD